MTLWAAQCLFYPSAMPACMGMLSAAGACRWLSGFGYS
ncbi:hypothetical protein CPter291_3881 [Collimonas pratensis]|uniref:Uncharacterized protein n=1 Tax=Collimonas pratensis TaxID=279113 RepID=A0ABM5ZAN7_9BURK|nr:hypothetical protein CPter291_3881 [Collimonas pratensis]